VQGNHECALWKSFLGRERSCGLRAVLNDVDKLGRSCHDASADDPIRTGIHFTPGTLLACPSGPMRTFDTSKHCPFSVPIGRARSPW